MFSSGSQLLIACACMLSHFSHVRLLETPCAVALQAPLSMGFSRQENWRGLPCLLPGDLVDPRMEPMSLMSPAMAGFFSFFFTSSATWGGGGFPGGLDGKESVCSVGDLGLIPGLGRSPEGEHGNPLQYYCLKDPHGQRNLSCYSPWSHKELDRTKRLSTYSILKSRKAYHS